MREIKFRAFWKDTLQPVIDFNENYGIDALNSDNFIVNQYTGRNDKNGKEVYEGDVILKDYGSCEIPVVVKFERGTFNLDFSNKIEVIGNVYQHPELLNQAK